MRLQHDQSGRGKARPVLYSVLGFRSVPPPLQRWYDCNALRCAAEMQCIHVRAGQVLAV